MLDPTSTWAFGGHDGGVKPIPTVIPPTVPVYERLHHVGHITLWVAFAIFLLSTATFSLLSWNVPTSKRLYHVLTTLACLTATVSYFALASGDGWSYKCETVTDVHDNLPDTHHEVCRQIHWARYVDWTISTPLLLTQLCVLAGVDGAHTLMASAASVVMTLSAGFAAFGNKHTAQKWGWFTIAVLAYVFVAWHVALIGGRTAKAKGDKIAKVFGGLVAYEFVLWTIYPIVWGVAEGAHKTSVDTGIVVYAVLDILAKVGFGLYILTAQRQTPEAQVDLDGWWSTGLSNEGRIRIGEDA